MENTARKKIIVIGAGPAGLTAAWELLRHPGYDVTILEQSGDIGGISKTVNYKGNRIDLGGHRFFSKSDRVMKWWNEMMPVQGSPSRDQLEMQVSYRQKSRAVTLEPGGPDPEKDSLVMLVRRRLSRIFFLRKFFDYPVSLNATTIRNLGPARIMRIGLSYMRIRLFPIRKEKSLEDFFINRFGKELYKTFFEDYTEKVWGVPCREIKPEWGAQRVKGLSVSKALLHAVRSLFRKNSDIAQKNTETSLIEQFLYPKLGPGQMWEEVAGRLKEKGCTLLMHTRACGVNIESGRVISVESEGPPGVQHHAADHLISTMPVRELIAAMGAVVPAEVSAVAQGLVYRDFITVGLLINKLLIKNTSGIPAPPGLVPDNWIYIQERDVKVGRLQIFNNWSPYMVSDPEKVWMGLEYFCNEGDALWRMDDAAFRSFAIEELARIGIISADDVLDATVIRMPKTYPAYFGSYDDFDVIRNFTDNIPNLFLVGRNGMHRYNNQDHSMLTAITAAENIRAGITTKENIWSVNTESEYHEEK